MLAKMSAGSARIQRGRWYRAEILSQIEWPWIIPYPVQIQLRTRKGRFTENIGQIPKGPSSLGGRFRRWQCDEGAMDDFFNARERTSPEFFVNEHLVFWCDVDGHGKHPSCWSGQFHDLMLSSAPEARCYTDSDALQPYPLPGGRVRHCFPHRQPAGEAQRSVGRGDRRTGRRLQIGRAHV